MQIIFQGCGGLYNYILGITKYIQQNYILPEDTIFTGVSAGTFPMILLALDKDIDHAWENWNIPLLAAVKAYKTGSLFNWNKVCKKHSYDYLPDDAHLLLKNKCHISVSRVNSLIKYKFDNEIISEWSSKDDFLNCLVASGFVPLFDTKFSFKFRDNHYIDGSLTDGEPQIIPKYQKATLVIQYNMFRTFPKRYMWCSTNVEWVTKLFELGYQDAKDNDHVFQTYMLKQKRK